jgi:hypothetical protein
VRFKEFLVELEGKFKARPTNQSWDQYTNFLLKQFGHDAVLGSGGSARVFSHPTDKNVAVKIFLARDVNYFKYAKWCMQNKSNPWVPRIDDIQFFQHGNGEEYGIVFMERLERLPARLYGKFLEDVGLNWSEFYQDEPGTMIKVIKNLKMRNEDPNLIKVLQFLQRSFTAYDFHRGNFMMRGRGQVVFVDPVGPPPPPKTIQR